MQKIKVMADSPCDIPPSEQKQYNIDILSVPIAVDGKGYFERKSFTMEQFYDIINAAAEIPVTSRVPIESFYDSYVRAMEEGYTDVICITINAGGSSTNASAHMAREHFYAQQGKCRLAIHIVDSGTYSLAYGLPAMEAARMAQEGYFVGEILEYLEDFFSRVEIYLGVYSLEFAKKSGRIGAASAFVGDMLGLRPVISMIAGNTKTVDKVRGDKNLAGRIFKAYQDNCADKTAPFAVVCGQDRQYGKELADLLEAETGYRSPIYTAGASIVINAGPRMLAVVHQGKKRG